MKTLYFDCFAGASGNMVLGALVDLGVDRSELGNRLQRLSVTDFSIEYTEVDRSGISSTHVNVVVPPETKHRHLHNIERIIDDSGLSDQVKERSKAIFTRLAQAEADVHGIDVQKVHFHEVGALDAIVDVVGSCIGFEMLGIERFVGSKINVGTGFVTMEHGTYPVPPPAVAKLLAGVPAYSNEIAGELLTPTGAAIISTVCESYGPLPEMRVEQTGYGAGTRTYDKFPNVLRLILGESEVETAGPTDSDLISERLVVLETNVDDLSPQVVGYVQEKAFELGALDCWTTPIQMKKNRPAAMLSLLCGEETKSALTEMLFLETSTLGVRSAKVDRLSLHREMHSVQTIYGLIDVKAATYRGRIVNVMPEYDQVKHAAAEHNVPFRVVHAETVASFKGIARSASS